MATGVSGDEDDPWEQIVQPVYDDVVRQLRPTWSGLLDKLHAKRLINHEEMEVLDGLPTEHERTRALVLKMMPYKFGKQESFRLFYRILAQCESHQSVLRLLQQSAAAVPHTKYSSGIYHTHCSIHSC